jgi:hypothetical protein
VIKEGYIEGNKLSGKERKERTLRERGDCKEFIFLNDIIS